MSVRFVQPMAASLVDALPTGDEWLYEAKFDGYRVLALKDGSTVKLLSRKGNDLTADYPAIHSAVSGLKAKAIVIDGEVVAFDEAGRPSFQHLHHRSAKPAAIRYFAFDLLHLNGKDLQREPLTVRREALGKSLRAPTSYSRPSCLVLPTTSFRQLRMLDSRALSPSAATRDTSRASAAASGRSSK